MACFYGTILSHADNLNNYHEARHNPHVQRIRHPARPADTAPSGNVPGASEVLCELSEHT
jgi:hypothetical protein